MNFSENERTGLKEEKRLSLLFTEWGWGTAKYEPDAGYDLIVEPDRTLFNSNGFYVQVKGSVKTPKPGHAIAARVSKSRLREYAVSELPVFIVRALPGGKFHWVHAQAWCRSNPDALIGNGQASVRFEPSQTIDSKENFVRILQPLLTPLAHRVDAMPVIAEQRSKYLFALDARLRAGVEYAGGRTAYSIEAAARDQPVTANFTLKLANASDVEAVARFRDFGFPLNIKATEFSITGSPVFDAVGTSKPHPSHITAKPRERDHISIVLYAGQPTIDSKYIEFDAEISKGIRGAGIRTESGVSYLKIEVLMTPLPAQGMQSQLTIGLDNDYVCNRPLKTISAIRPFIDWYENAISGGSITVSFESDAGRAGTTIPLKELDSIRTSLESAYLIAKAHIIARELGSTITLPRDRDFTKRDIQDIENLHQVLNGKSVYINLSEFVIPGTVDDKSPIKMLQVKTSFHARLFDEAIGVIPIILEIRDYDAHPHGNGTRLTPRSSRSFTIRRNPELTPGPLPQAKIFTEVDHNASEPF